MNSGLDEVTLKEIANHAHVSVDDVRRTYQSLLNELSDQAKVHDFIPLLAMKKVRQHFPRHSPFSSANIVIKQLPEEKMHHSDFFEKKYAQ